MKLFKLLLFTLLLFLFSCNKKLVNNPTQDAAAVDSAYVGNYSDEEIHTETEEEPKETRLRFSGYTVIFHDFKGYDLSYGEHEIPAVIFGGNENNPYAVLNSDEREVENYIETVIVKHDSVYINEDLDIRINNTLIEIVPQNPKDRFKVSMSYLTTLNEITDYRNHTPEELEKIYESFRPVKEITEYTSIKDSADYYFRALPHTADMEAITVVDGQIVPVKKRNTKKQIEDEEFRYNKELERVKKKYGLKDTLVIIPGEYDTVATLTKNKKLYGYSYDYYLFKIERYTRNKKIDTKYVVVSIMYGC